MSKDIAAFLSMALLINELCVNCDVCAPVCPNTAISMGAEIYEIDPAHCTECVGHFDEPQCVEVCPVECIDLDPAHVESTDDLLSKLAALGTAPDATAQHSAEQAEIEPQLRMAANG